jgi:phosphotriesterase-related protein
MNRRNFTRLLTAGGGLSFVSPLSLYHPTAERPVIMTVTGPIDPARAGTSLSHEHLLVDFIGAKDTGYHRWDRQEVLKVLLPHLERLQAEGCQTFFDCTPAYLGRDPVLLHQLAVRTGIHIVTNTGYYGARNNQFLPAHAFEETADQLAARWTKEWKSGIEDTRIRPGFIKIGVDEGPLSDLHHKLILAAARTHRATGLTIAAHTGTATGAFQQLEVLRQEAVRPDAFVWVHAQAEKDSKRHEEAGRLGAWVSFDGVSEDSIDEYTALLWNMRSKGLLHRTLVSHDAGWYSPGEPGGGEFRDFTAIFRHLLPSLRHHGFTVAEIDQLLVHNPQKAFTVSVRTD